MNVKRKPRSVLKMKNFTAIFLSICFLCSCNPARHTLTCKDFRNGVFKYRSLYGFTTITRRDSIQTESIGSSSLSANIRWIDSCQYELALLGQDLNGSDSLVRASGASKVRTRLISFGTDYAVFETRADGFEQVLRDTLFKVSD